MCYSLLYFDTPSVLFLKLFLLHYDFWPNLIPLIGLMSNVVSKNILIGFMECVSLTSLWGLHVCVIHVIVTCETPTLWHVFLVVKYGLLLRQGLLGHICGMNSICNSPYIVKWESLVFWVWRNLQIRDWNLWCLGLQLIIVWLLKTKTTGTDFKVFLDFILFYFILKCVDLIRGVSIPPIGVNNFSVFRALNIIEFYPFLC